MILEGEVMKYKNLHEEMRNRGIDFSQCCDLIGICKKSLYNKLNGETEFTLTEVKKIRELFSDCGFDYLFAEQNKE